MAGKLWHNVRWGPPPAGVSGPIDAWGNVVGPEAAEYVAAIQTIHGTQHYVWATNPNYNSGIGGAGSAPAQASPQYTATFDTIGQTIYRTIGCFRVPLRTIWQEGISESGEVTGAKVAGVALALCAPFDPDEEGQIQAVFMGGTAIFAGGSFTAPSGMEADTASLLSTSLANMRFYPGTEAQMPDPLIVTDKGAHATPAFRGLRYIVLPGYPLAAGNPSNLSLQYTRENDLGFESGAFEFPA